MCIYVCAFSVFYGNSGFMTDFTDWLKWRAATITVGELLKYRTKTDTLQL